MRTFVFFSSALKPEAKHDLEQKRGLNGIYNTWTFDPMLIRLVGLVVLFSKIDLKFSDTIHHILRQRG